MLYYESLAVYQKALSANQEIYLLIKNNKSIPPYMKNQLGRSSLSIMLNIAEGTAKVTARDRRNFFIIARGSTFESASIIKFLAAENEISEELKHNCYSSFEEISKMLFAMIQKLSNQQNT